MKKLFFVLFLASVFLAYLSPIELGDVWWHLRTGQWIVEHGALPEDEDPFSVTAPSGIGSELSAFWISQIFIYSAYKVAGLYGLIGLKALLFCLTFIVLVLVIKDVGIKEPLSYAVLLPLVFFGIHYGETRPQSFSFLFFAITLYLLERQRRDGKPSYPLLVLMPLWANSHPGFVSGAGLLAVYSLWQVRWLRPKTLSLNAASFALSALNPNGLRPIGWTLGLIGGSLRNQVPIHEHLSPQKFAQMTGETAVYGLVIFFALTGGLSFLISIIKRKLPDFLHLMLFALFCYAAFSTFRAGMFFALFWVAVISKNLAMFEISPKVQSALRPVVFVAVIAITALVFIPSSIIKRPAMNESLIPKKVSDYLLKEGPGGALFNPYEWGGYLIWRLYPKYRVFADGRALLDMEEYDRVLRARPGWQAILSKYKVEIVTYWPLLPYDGRVPQIVFALLKSDEWSPVYWDLTSVVFVRTEIAKTTIKKSALWELLTSLALTNIPSKGAKAYIALGEIYAQRQMPSEAKRAFQEALRLDPKNIEARILLETDTKR